MTKVCFLKRCSFCQVFWFLSLLMIRVNHNASSQTDSTVLCLQFPSDSELNVIILECSVKSKGLFYNLVGSNSIKRLHFYQCGSANIAKC